MSSGRAGHLCAASCVAQVAAAVLVLLQLSGCWLRTSPEEEAIRRVRDATCPIPPFAAMMIGAPIKTYGDYVEAIAKRDFGSTEGFTWRATQQREGLKPDEWLVTYTNAGGGFAYVLDGRTGAVADPHHDVFLAARIGTLHPSDRPALGLTDLRTGVVQCSSWSAKGLCFEVAGTATNLGAAIIELNAEADLTLRIGDRVFDGEGFRNNPDEFRRTSASTPWPSGEARTFSYRSKLIPEVYAETPADALGTFEVTTATVSSGSAEETYVAEAFKWVPDNLPR